jgi:branched-chain amino acid transport system substrate-binding protein
MNRPLRALVVAVAALLASPSALPAQSPAPIVVGAILSYTGPSAPLGQPQVNALKLAETDINGHGGVKGRPIHFDIVDDEAKADVASQLATQMVGRKVAALICGTRTDTSQAVARVSAAERVLQIIMVPTANIWQSQSGGVVGTIFQATPRDQLEAAASIAYARSKLNVRSIAIVHDANFYGTNGSAVASAQAIAAGMTVIDVESYAGDATDFTAQLVKVRNAKPDAIVLWGATTTPALVVRQARALGITIPILGTSGILSPAFINVAGDAGRGVYATSNLDPAGGSAEQRRAAALYDAAYHAPFVAFAAQAWDAAHILATALASAGGDGEKLASWLSAGKPILGAQGTFRFSSVDHNGLRSSDVHVLTISGGRWSAPS